MVSWPEGGDIFLPVFLVEVHRQEPARLIRQQRVHPDRVATPEVVENNVVRHGVKGLVRALAALHLRLVADPLAPLIGARRRISLLPRSGVAPELREDVRPASEERPEERHLFAVALGRLLDRAIVRQAGQLITEGIQAALRLSPLRLQRNYTGLLCGDPYEELFALDARLWATRHPGPAPPQG